MKVMWNGSILAQSPETIEVEGIPYFPKESLHLEHFRPSQTRTVCGWKGQAFYYDIEVHGKINKDAAWYYPHPKPAAREIEGMVAFRDGIKVIDG